jgi:CheY-like chemotaxis protein
MADILIVDDDHSVRTSLRLMLQGLGHEIDEAQNGAEALAAFHRRPSDLIITDLLMPGMDGFEIIRSLRNQA